jgi:hypothetical protein
VRSIEANAGLLLPFRRVRWTQALLGSFHASTDQYRCSTCGADSREDLVRRAVRGGWMLNASRQYGYSISTEEGWRAMVSTEITREALGADGDSGAALADVRGYVPVWPRHGVIAARLAGATTWGEQRVRRIYSAAGSGPQPLQFEFGSDAIGLLRGLDESDEQNFHAAVANLDYRFPLLRVQRGAGTLPIFLRTIHGALFADAGNAWRESFRWHDVRASTGGELSMDVVLGYVLPVTFTAGASWVFDGAGGHAAAFARIGRAF